MLKRAAANQKASFNVVNLRDFTDDRHQTADDRPFGGGPGMVMMIEPIDRALKSLEVKKATANELILLTSAKGKLFVQSDAIEFSKLEKLTIICGHYEGVDERVAEHLIDGEIRIGDYVLTGGEAASVVIIDAVTRLIPGVLGNESSIIDESHSVVGISGTPQYTKPVEYQGWTVPPVLLTGHHINIAAWKQGQKKKL